METFSVMGDPATAMRDPIFYRWHAYVDYVFQQHKETLPPYSEQVASRNFKPQSLQQFILHQYFSLFYK